MVARTDGHTDRQRDGRTNDAITTWLSYRDLNKIEDVLLPD